HFTGRSKTKRAYISFIATQRKPMPVAGACAPALGRYHIVFIRVAQREIPCFSQWRRAVAMLLAQFKTNNKRPAFWGLLKPLPARLGFRTGYQAIGQKRGAALVCLAEIIEKTAVDTIRDRQKHAGGDRDINA